jgi:Protein of unknown function (DUF3108)
LVIAMSVVAIAGFVLSLGPDGLRSVYATLHRYVFGFQAIRAPARFAVLVFLGLSTLAAVGWRELWEAPSILHVWSARRGQWQMAMFVVAALELLHLPVTLAAAPPLQTAVGRWLQHEPTPGAVAVLPLSIDVDNTPAMVQSLEHRRPLLNGYSGQRPAFYPSLVDALSAFPSEEAMLALLESDVRFVVTPTPVTIDGRQTALVERVRFDEGTIYELRWTPDIDARVRTHTAIEPPPPGPVPFREGERASYTVSWGGAGNVTAGTIEMRVEGPPYRFVVSAETAPWIARFYEVHAVLTTIANDRLMPQQQERRMQEGSRSVNRTYLFDNARGVIRIGASVEDAWSAQAVTLPLAAHARDAIATLFYARTLPLTPGARYRVPINDGGRNGIVDFTVSGPDTVLVQGRQRPAMRMEPRIDRRVERRTPPSATVWLDPDGAHVPLAVDITAAFGTVRMELTGYDPGPVR